MPQKALEQLTQCLHHSLWDASPLYCSGNYSAQTLSSSSQASNIWTHICWLTSPDNSQHSPPNTNWICLLPATLTANILNSGPGGFHIHSIPGTDLTGPEFLKSSVSSTLLPKPLTYKAIMPFLSLRIFADSKVGLDPWPTTLQARPLAIWLLLSLQCEPTCSNFKTVLAFSPQSHPLARRVL